MPVASARPAWTARPLIREEPLDRLLDPRSDWAKELDLQKAQECALIQAFEKVMKSHQITIQCWPNSSFGRLQEKKRFNECVGLWTNLWCLEQPQTFVSYANYVMNLK